MPHRDPNGIQRRSARGGNVQRAAESKAAPSTRPADARLLGIPRSARADVMLQLQRQHGNRLVQSLLAPAAGPAAVQAEGLADDEEMQAEGAEEEELQMEGEEEELQAEGEEEELQAEGEEEELQAEGEEEELQMAAEDEEEVQMEGEEEELQAEGAEGAEAEEEELQMAGDSATLQRRPANVAHRIQAARGGGSSLDGASLQRFNAAFGQSFEHVRVHTDATADRLSRDVNAKAFTTGSDIFFRGNQYQPGTAEGDHLLAHELTHVVQQGQGLVPTGHQSSGGKGGATPGDIFEQEAAATADAITSGQPLPGTTAATANVQRKRNA
jgi:hypothetical protein